MLHFSHPARMIGFHALSLSGWLFRDEIRFPFHVWQDHLTPERHANAVERYYVHSLCILSICGSHVHRSVAAPKPMASFGLSLASTPSSIDNACYVPSGPLEVNLFRPTCQTVLF